MTSGFADPVGFLCQVFSVMYVTSGVGGGVSVPMLHLGSRIGMASRNAEVLCQNHVLQYGCEGMVCILQCWVFFLGEMAYIGQDLTWDPWYLCGFQKSSQSIVQEIESRGWGFHYLLNSDL